VFTLLGRVPELHVAVLGALKNRGVACPLFSAFGPEPVRQRLQLGDGRVLVTTPGLYRRKVAPIRDRLPALDHVVLIGTESAATSTRRVTIRPASRAAGTSRATWSIAMPTAGCGSLAGPTT
jgi:acetyl-CoA synthetase